MLSPALSTDSLLASPSPEAARSLLDSLWAWLIDSGLRIVVILLLATVLSAVVNWLIKRFVSTMVTSSTALSNATSVVVKRTQREMKAAQQRRSQRAETFSNVARNIARMVIWAIAIVMVLSEIGVNIAPVIASLGVIGLAAGIGAQTIIKDFVAGIVMLFEDIVAVGDVVDLEYATGTVVEINLRVTQVRSLDGVLWTVRNGEIIRIGNMSRGYSTALVLLDIDAQADNLEVTRVLEEVAREFEQDEDWAEELQGAVTISGILTVDGARFQRRLTVDVAPGQQWSVEQELRRRIRRSFRAANIDFALPRFTEATGN